MAAREFEIRKQVELPATPAEVWDAVATGPGLCSWLFPFEVEPGEGGVLRLSVQQYTEESEITAWEPGVRLAVQSEENPDGTVMSYEYLIEGGDDGATQLTFVHSGRLGDGWGEAGEEYESTTSHGWDQYLHTLDQYLRYFRGRHAVYVVAVGPQDRTDAWPRLATALELSDVPRTGDQIRLPDGTAGVADYVVPPAEHGFFLGVRTDDALYRFHGRPDGGVDVENHLFAENVDQRQAERFWTDWLARVYA